MSNEKKIELAKEYVDKQLETMRQFGSAPKDISDHEYKALVQEIAETIKS